MQGKATRKNKTAFGIPNTEGAKESISPGEKSAKGADSNFPPMQRYSKRGKERNKLRILNNHIGGP